MHFTVSCWFLKTATLPNQFRIWNCPSMQIFRLWYKSEARSFFLSLTPCTKGTKSFIPQSKNALANIESTTENDLGIFRKCLTGGCLGSGFHGTLNELPRKRISSIPQTVLKLSDHNNRRDNGDFFTVGDKKNVNKAHKANDAFSCLKQWLHDSW